MQPFQVIPEPNLKQQRAKNASFVYTYYVIGAGLRQDF